METFIEPLSVLLDAIILTSYLYNYFGAIHNRIKKFFFFTAIILTELLLELNMQFTNNLSSNKAVIVTAVISVITTMALCLFYTKKIRVILFVAIIFQMFAAISEQVCVIIYNYFIKGDYQIDTAQLYITMNFMSKFVLYIMIMLFTFVWKRKLKSNSVPYNLLIYVTPVISIIIYILIPMDAETISSNRTFYISLCTFIAILNIVNFCLLNILTSSIKASYSNILLNNQIHYQNEKYTQISESYKRSRRIIHDVKKHYLTIRNYIDSNAYNKLSDYLKDMTNELESNYVIYNTGNLVIDSLVTNSADLAKKCGCIFNADLPVDYNRIPVKDYDLCIIIGNLLDNSVNACKKTSMLSPEIYLQIDTTENDQFTILIQNTYDIKDKSTHTDSFEHGYGLMNVKACVEKYSGLMSIETEDNLFIVKIIIPIIDSNQRSTPPLYPNERIIRCKI